MQSGIICDTLYKVTYISEVQPYLRYCCQLNYKLLLLMASLLLYAAFISTVI